MPQQQPVPWLNPHLKAKEIIEDALRMAADIDIYTNHNRTILEIEK